MQKELAELVVKELSKQDGPKLTVYEAMDMTKIKSDNLEVYAIQKGDCTIMAWVSTANGYYVRTEIYCWAHSR